MRRNLLLACLTGLLCLCLAAPTLADGRIIKIAADEEKRGGHLAEITEAAFKRVGYEPQFDFVPWARALKGTVAGSYQVLLAAYYNEERARTMLYSEPIGTVEVYFWALKDKHLHYETLSDMKPYLIGFIRGSTVSPEFDAALNTTLQVNYTSSAELNLKNLLTGRIDAFVEKKQQVDYLLQTTFAKDASRVETVGAPLKVGKFHNTVSKAIPNAQQILDDFHKGLKLIRQDGTEKAILTKHGMR